MKTYRTCLLACTGLLSVMQLGGMGPLLAADLQQAQTHLLRGRYAEAIEAIGESPSSAAEAIVVARSLEARGKREEAAAKLQKFAEAKQPTADTWTEAARLAWERGDLDVADKAVTRALALDTNQTLARWLQAELARARGDLEAAQKHYEWFIDFYNARDAFDDPEELYYVGQAAAQYARWTRNSGQFQFLVSELYPQILKIEPNYWPAELALSELFAEKYNLAEAVRHLNLALGMNPASSEILAHKAALELRGYRVEDALRTAEQALALNPQSTAAMRLRGQAKLTDFRPQQSVEILQAAVALNPINQSSQGYLAAALLAADSPALLNPETGETTRFGELLEDVETNYKNSGEFYAALGDGCDMLRKYPEAVKYLQAARERMPQLIAVPGDLGMVLMRMGEEKFAKEVLDEAFEVDPFNVRVKNTLEVLDVLAGYETIETDHFIIRFDPEKDRLLAAYMSKFLEEHVHPVVCQGLGYEPDEKTLIEIFNDAKSTTGHGWFSARMVGLPYIGTVGACAGKMIALASPNAVSEPYNWAHVIRHEFVHVVNLQQTDFNIPHWFTEALAVTYESEQQPPDWKTLLAKRLAEDRLFNLDTINYGFIRPADQDDWTMAYCQSFYYARFIEQQFGEDALQRMLAAYREYKTTDEILSELFQVEKETFEAEYVDFLREQVSGVVLPATSKRSFSELVRSAEENPQDADTLAELAHVYLQRKSLPDARRHAVKALAVEENHPLALYVMGRLLLSIGDTDEAIEKIEQAVRGPRFDRHSVAMLAALRLKQGKTEEALELYQKGAENEPSQLDWKESILRVHLLQKENDALEKLIPQIAAQKHHDRLLRKKMADILLQKKEWKGAADWAHQAIGIDVTDPEGHLLLAKAYQGQAKWAEAAYEFEVAGELRPKQVLWLIEAAKLYQQAGQGAKAKAIAEKVLENHPENTEAQALLK